MELFKFIEKKHFFLTPHHQNTLISKLFDVGVVHLISDSCCDARARDHAQTLLIAKRLCPRAKKNTILR